MRVEPISIIFRAKFRDAMKKATGDKVFKPSNETLGDSSQTLNFIIFVRTVDFILYSINCQVFFIYHITSNITRTRG